MFHKILVAYDGSAGAEAALRAAVEQAAVAGQDLWLVTVASAPPALGLLGAPAMTPEQEQALAAQIQAAADRVAGPAGVTMHSTLLGGNVAKCLVDAASEGGFDLLVLGQSGQSAVWGPFLGTTADKVVRHAPCSVLVVRPEPPLAAEAVTFPQEAEVPAGLAVAGLGTLPPSTGTELPATGAAPKGE